MTTRSLSSGKFCAVAASVVLPTSSVALAFSVLALTVTALVPPRAQTQQVLRVPSTPSCASCSITAHRVALLVDDERNAQLSELLMLSQDSRGLLYGTDVTMGAGQIKVFDGSGRLVRIIGRDGEGPGEFRQIMPPAFGPGDTIYVVDYGLRRVTKLSPSGSYLQSHGLPGIPSQFIKIENGYLMSGMIRTGSSVGWPVHTLTSEGNVRTSFGAETPVLDPLRPELSRRIIGLSREDQVWSALTNRYVIERWNLEGSRTLVIERVTDWYEPWERYRGPSTVTRPPARVHAVWEDAAGRLWVAITVADADWERTNFRANQGDEIRMPRANNHGIYDTVIEIIDPIRGVLIATRRFPQLFQSMGNGEPFIAYHEDEVGHPRYEVWQFLLTDASR